MGCTGDLKIKHYFLRTIISEVLWHSPGGNLTGNVEDNNPQDLLIQEYRRIF